jgi:chaperonin cofactor prefoldin
MFQKQIIIDGKGHLLGRLASYVAKQLLSGTVFITQDKESSLSELKQSTSPDHSSEIKLDSLNSSEKDY